MPERISMRYTLLAGNVFWQFLLLSAIRMVSLSFSSTAATLVDSLPAF